MTVDPLAPASEILALGLDQGALRRYAADHLAAAQHIADAAGDTLSATDQRKVNWHTRQAEALDSTAHADINYDQVVQRHQPDRPSDRPGRSESRRAADAAIERQNRSGLLSDAGAELLTRMCERGTALNRDRATRYAAVAGDEHYASAFGKLIADPQRGHMRFTDDERRAYGAVEEFRSWVESVPASAGLLVPSVLDPAVMLTNPGVASPLRDVARVVSVPIGAGDRWSGISSEGTTTEWVGEAVEVAEQVPEVANPQVLLHKLSTYTEASIELLQDGVRVVENLLEVMRDAAINATELAYTVGGGSTEPEGLITGLVAGSQTIAPTVAESFTAADVYKIQNSLGPRFQQGASWLANLAIINQAAQFESTNGSILFPEIRSDRLVRRPLRELSTMDGAYDASATADNYLLAYGDWRRCFVIADKIGATVEVVQHVLGANRRPTGERGIWMYLRTGSSVVVPEAGRVLSVPTTE